MWYIYTVECNTAIKKNEFESVLVRWMNLEPVIWSEVSQKESGQVVWYSHLFQNFPHFIVIHTVKGFGIVNKAEIDVFLELSCFFDGPVDFGNLITGSSAFSKSSLNFWKFTVHILLKPALEKLSITFLACEMSALVW